ncbi:hypothetical protein [Azospirillum palustre]
MLSLVAAEGLAGDGLAAAIRPVQFSSWGGCRPVPFLQLADHADGKQP